MEDHSYHFNCLQIPYGDAFIEVNGTAKYQIEDLSSGEQGDPEELHAFFFKVRIRSYETKKENELQGVTIDDLAHLEDKIIDILNDDYELCSNLPNQNNNK
jgi:hypothetical protein